MMQDDVAVSGEAASPHVVVSGDAASPLLASVDEARELQYGHRGRDECAHASAYSSMDARLVCRPTKYYPVLERQAITDIASKPNYGKRLCGRAGKHTLIFDHVADLSRDSCTQKVTDVTSTVWSYSRRKTWLHRSLDLRAISERSSLQCVPDVYQYEGALPGTLVVDFANQHVGGGCWSGGFVQEEQMVAQSLDFAVRLHKHRETIGRHEVVSYQGVHMDAWWPRAEAAKKTKLNMSAVKHCLSQPLTILAVDAPDLSGINSRGATYSEEALLMLAEKISLIFGVAAELQSPVVFSGLLGGGAFRGNRPLVLALHAMLQPASSACQLLFHCPIFQSNGGRGSLEQAVVGQADQMLEVLRQRGVSTLAEALDEVLSWQLPLSLGDADLRPLRLSKPRCAGGRANADT